MLRAREQLDGHDVGEGIDEAPAHDARRVVGAAGILQDARHVDAQQHGIDGDPHRDQGGIEPVGAAEQDQRGGQDDDGAAHRIDAGREDGGHCRRRLDHLAGEAAGEIVLEVAVAVPVHMQGQLPPHEVGEGRDGMLEISHWP